MGLDVVELVLRVEETFGIDLPDDELQSVRTVGDLYQLVLSKLDGGDVCLSSRTFYRVRKAMTELLDVPSRSIRPATELQSLLPKSIRREMWMRIAEKTALNLPALEYPSWFQRLALGLGIAAAIVACFAANRWAHSYESWAFFQGFYIVLLIAVGCATLAVTWKSLHVAASSLGIVLPAKTTGELARSVLARNYPHIREGAQRAAQTNRNEIWQVLRQIVVEQLQVREEDVVPDARFLEDLGVD